MITINQALNLAAQNFKRAKIKTAFLDSEVLLAFILNQPKEFLYTYPQKKLTKSQFHKLQAIIKKRTKGEPVAYLKNQKEFYGLNFYVDKRVLIPRPETELLVEEAAKLLKAISYQPAGRQAGLKAISIADIGTGSGCAIIALVKTWSEIRDKKSEISCYGTDISKSALQVAKKNARKHQVKIKFCQGSLLEPLKNKKIDVILANLPYGWPQWLAKSSAETAGLKFEPKKSLFAKEGGLYLYRRLFGQIAEMKLKPKLILIEFDPRQKKALAKLAKKYLPAGQLEIKKDLAGLNRILIIKQ
ncbi:MAG: peptide chain release factor N(5)-glutamine methyltransferase [Patescibacteria group bacterium]|jgi:release factor glutamine methyltransferase